MPKALTCCRLYVVDQPEDTLRIGPDLNPDALDRILGYSMLVWNQHGRYGLVPVAVLRNALDQYRTWHKFQSVAPRSRPPRDVGVIHWAQVQTPCDMPRLMAEWQAAWRKPHPTQPRPPAPGQSEAT